ncbi:MAG: carbohydrate ABC transporter permease [Lachnospiraceae bacterium]|nr:carbohydrate ABC transporter permease [Lachnospiraceae bacterium]
MKRLSEDTLVDAVVMLLLLIVGILTLYPFYYTIVCSFSDGIDLLKGGVYLWPRKFTLANYHLFLTDADWIHAFLVSVLRTVVGTTCCVSCTALFSYALSRRNLLFRNTYRFMVVFTMYFSGGLIPFYILLKNLGLLNSFGVYIIPAMLNTFFVITGMNFFSSIPESMLESARIDGARELQIFRKIVFPVSKPFIATLSLFVAVGQWNSWLDSAYYVRDRELQTLSYKMMMIINQSISSAANSEVAGQISEANSATNFTIQSTAMVISMLPIMLVYPFLQKYFVQGMMIGAVKE